jgi:uncharacterized OB-fold protein
MTEKEISNAVKPVVPGIFVLPSDDRPLPALLGGFCETCGMHYFPRPNYCRSCLGPLKETTVGSEGIIYSFTVIRKKPPFGLPLPYGAGFVDLKETGLRIFSLLDPEAVDQLCIGLPVQLAVAPIGHDGSGNPCLRPFFKPLPKEEA